MSTKAKVLLVDGSMLLAPVPADVVDGDVPRADASRTLEERPAPPPESAEIRPSRLEAGEEGVGDQNCRTAWLVVGAGTLVAVVRGH